MEFFCFFGTETGAGDLSDTLPFNTLSRYKEALRNKKRENNSYHSATANPSEGRGQVMRAACSLPRKVKEPERVPFCNLTHSCRFKDKSQEAASFHWLSLQSHTSSLPASFPQALATSFD